MKRVTSSFSSLTNMVSDDGNVEMQVNSTGLTSAVFAKDRAGKFHYAGLFTDDVTSDGTTKVGFHPAK